MEYRNADYFVKGTQFMKLQEAVDSVREFHDAITDIAGCFSLRDIEEDDLVRMHREFSDAVRELRYLAEDISGQVLAVFEG